MDHLNLNGIDDESCLVTLPAAGTVDMDACYLIATSLNPKLQIVPPNA